MDVGRILPGRVNRAAGVPRASIWSIVRGQMLDRVSPVMRELTKTHLVPKHARRVRQHAQPMRFSRDAAGTMGGHVNRVPTDNMLMLGCARRARAALRASIGLIAWERLRGRVRRVCMGHTRRRRGLDLVCPVTNATSTN